MELYQQVEGISKEKIDCTCGNTDWKQFLYVGTDIADMFAGCKRCGRTYRHRGQEWIGIQGPHN